MPAYVARALRLCGFVPGNGFAVRDPAQYYFCAKPKIRADQMRGGHELRLLPGKADLRPTSAMAKTSISFSSRSGLRPKGTVLRLQTPRWSERRDAESVWRSAGCRAQASTGRPRSRRGFPAIRLCSRRSRLTPLVSGVSRTVSQMNTALSAAKSQNVAAAPCHCKSTGNM